MWPVSTSVPNGSRTNATRRPCGLSSGRASHAAVEVALAERIRRAWSGPCRVAHTIRLAPRIRLPGRTSSESTTTRCSWPNACSQAGECLKEIGRPRCASGDRPHRRRDDRERLATAQYPREPLRAVTDGSRHPTSQLPLAQAETSGEPGDRHVRPPEGHHRLTDQEVGALGTRRTLSSIAHRRSMHAGGRSSPKPTPRNIRVGCPAHVSSTAQGGRLEWLA